MQKESSVKEKGNEGSRNYSYIFFPIFFKKFQGPSRSSFCSGTICVADFLLIIDFFFIYCPKISQRQSWAILFLVLIFIWFQKIHG